MNQLARHRRQNTTLADMTNSRAYGMEDGVEETLLNNLPVMAVAPMPIPTTVTSMAEDISYTPGTSVPVMVDEKMVAATLAAIETGSITPLVKEELKCSILTRRFVEGKEDIKVEFTVPEKKVLTEEEQERAVVRREQNRMAARRFRRKQKDTSEFLLKKTQKLESSNTKMRCELHRLQQERDRLKQLLTDHLMVCPVQEPSLNLTLQP
ncbi:cyclic AMP-dependent transcription factor ATF-3-like [Haliotis rubra]|uniref:cyclic AMP-dependent transcription factor ATF-3-like n=1 Tax=Haliotis rubra TaxID=36100 RepID=UPI001EE6273A|nr:cyclic AMP-dependent transcription factor ATF-3-like [Haliotis rubra]